MREFLIVAGLLLLLMLAAQAHDLATVIVCDEHDQTGTLVDVEDVCIGVDLR